MSFADSLSQPRALALHAGVRLLYARCSKAARCPGFLLRQRDKIHFHAGAFLPVKRSGRILPTKEYAPNSIIYTHQAQALRRRGVTCGRPVARVECILHAFYCPLSCPTSNSVPTRMRTMFCKKTGAVEIEVDGSFCARFQWSRRCAPSIFSSAGLSRSFKIMFACQYYRRSLHRRHIRHRNRAS